MKHPYKPRTGPDHLVLDRSVLVRVSLNRTKVNLKYIWHVIINFETLSVKNFKGLKRRIWRSLAIISVRKLIEMMVNHQRKELNEKSWISLQIGSFRLILTPHNFKPLFTFNGFSIKWHPSNTKQLTAILVRPIQKITTPKN